MSKFVQAQVISKNSSEYDVPVVEMVPCTATTQTVQWRTPVVGGVGNVVRYDYLMSVDKPTPDAVKVLRLYDPENNEDIVILLQDGADLNLFSGKCDACCGTPQSMPAVQIPETLVEIKGCNAVDGVNYTYFALVTPLAAGQVYTLSGSANNQALATPPADGFASLAAIQTWVAANWGSAGTWAIDGTNANRLNLTSTTTKSAAINISKSFYFDSGTAPTPSGGQVLQLVLVANGITVTPPLQAASVAALVAAANAAPAYANKGKFVSITGGTKIRLTSTVVSTATLTITAVTP